MSMLRYLSKRVAAFFASFVLVCTIWLFSQLIYLHTIPGEQIPRDEQPPFPVGATKAFRVGSAAFSVLFLVSVIGLVGVAIRSKHLVRAYNCLLTVTRDLSIFFGIAAIVFFIVQLEKAANGSLAQNAKDCLAAVDETNRNGTTDPKKVPDSCYIALSAGIDLSLTLAWCGALVFMFFWNLCASMAVSRYYKELTEVGDGHIALDESADHVLTNDLPALNTASDAV